MEVRTTYNRYNGNTGSYIRLPDAYSDDIPTRPRMGSNRGREPYIERPGNTVTEQHTPKEDDTQQNIDNMPNRSAPQKDSGAFRPNNARHNSGSMSSNHQNKNRPSRSRQPAGRGSDSLEGLLANLGGGLSSRLGNLDTEDLLLMAVVYLMYRANGDKQLLIVLAALLFS